MMKKIAVWMCCDENGSDANELFYQTFFNQFFQKIGESVFTCYS